MAISGESDMKIFNGGVCLERTLAVSIANITQ